MREVKNKKGFLSGIIVFLAALFIGAISYSSCEVGLGAAVDTQPPSITIVTPEVDKVIRDKFAISGTWSDDGIIDNVSVSLKRTDGKTIDGSKAEREYSASFETDEIDKGKGTWQAIINPLEQDSTIIDGTYQAIVTIKDKGNHSTTQSTTFTVDNTPPVLILTKPNSTPNDSTLSSYGQRLFLEGSIADSTKDTWIKIDFYSGVECTSDQYLTTIETGIISPTDVNSNNARLAIYNTDLTQQYASEYFKLYRNRTEKSGSEEVYAILTVYDTAETIPVDGQADTTLSNGKIKGNSTQTFYLTKQLAESITKSQTAQGYGLAPIDIYNVLNDTYVLKNESRAAESTTIKSKLAEYEQTKSVFTINPENSPYFTISGLKTLNKNGKDFEENTIVNGTQTLEVSVFMGTDSIAIKDDDDFYVYALECDIYGNPKKADVEENRIKLYSKYKETGSGAEKKTYYKVGGKTDHKTTSGAYVFNIPMNKTLKADPDKGLDGFVELNIEYGKNYIIRVSGKDTEGNPIESTDGGYGFNFSAGGTAPRITVTEPADNTVFIKKGDGLKVKGSVVSEEGEPRLTIFNGEASVDIPVSQAQEGVYTFDKDISASELGFAQNQSVIYSIVFKATRDSTEANLTKSIWYDVDGPVVTMNDPIPLVKAGTIKANGDIVSDDSVNGIITFSGSIIDEFDSRFGSASYKVLQDGNQVDKPGLSGTLSKNYSFTIDTKELSDEKDVVVVITAFDCTGNKTEKQYTCYVDQSTDKPRIASSESSKDITRGVGPAGLNYVQEGNNLFVRAGNLVLSVTDDDDVAQTSVKVQKYDESSNSLSAPAQNQEKTYESTSVVTHTLPSEVGIYQVEVTAIDTGIPANSNTIKFYIRVTGTGPDVTITPDREYVKTGGVYNLNISMVNEGNRPYKIKINDNDSAVVQLANDADDYDIQVTPTVTNGKVDPVKFTVIDKNSSFTEKIFTPKFDDELPSVSITSSPDNMDQTEDESFLFKGTASDDAGAGKAKSGIEKVEIMFSNTADSTVKTDWIECNGTEKWNYEANWTGTALATVFDTENNKTVTVRATDGAGNEKTTSTTFDFDKKLPVITIGAAPEAVDGKNDLDVEITINDTNPVKPTVVVKNEAGTTLNISGITISNVTGSGETYTSTIKLPFKTGISNGTYIFEVTGHDQNGRNSVPKQIKIKRDDAPPKVTIDTPGSDIEWTQALSDLNYTFKIHVTDVKDGNAGVGVSKIYYAFSDSTDIPADDDWTSETFSDGDKFITRDLTEGVLYLHAKAEDKSGNTSSPVCRKISVDRTAPTLTVTGLNESGVNAVYTEVKDDGFTLSGSVSDTNELNANDAVEILIDDVSAIKIKKSELGTNGSWSYKIPKAKLIENEPVIVKIVAKDITERQDRTTTKNFTVYYDTADPDLVVSAPVTDEAVETNTKAIKGTISDGGYGIKSLEYKLYKGGTTEVVKTSDNKEVSGSIGSGNFPITVKGEQWYISGEEKTIPLGSTQGALKLVVTATENDNGKTGSEKSGGRVTEETINFYYDEANPGLGETGINTTGLTTNASFTLQGTAWDSNELSYVEIKCTVNGQDKTWKLENSASGLQSKPKSEPASVNWSINFVVGSGNNSAPNYIDDGTKEFTIIAYDAAKKKTQLTRTVVVDTTSPVLTSISPVINTTGATLDGATWYQTRSISVTAGATDTNGSGVSSIEYTTETGDSATWSPLSYSSGSYSGTINFSDDGEQSFRIRAKDVAGNLSEPKSTSLKIDTTKPTLETKFYKLGTGADAPFSVDSAEGTVYVKADTQITLYGTYEDAQSGVKALSVEGVALKDNTSMSISYSATDISGTTIPVDSTFKEYTGFTSAQKNTIKTWKAVFTPKASGTIVVTGANRLATAGTTTDNVTDKPFKVTYDNEAPKLSNIKLYEVVGTAENEAYSNGGNWYTNNTVTNRKYKITGIATDKIGLASVEISITGNTQTLTNSGSLGEWEFSNINLSGLTDSPSSTTATITVKDYAGNEASDNIVTIKFDTTAPVTTHKIDDSKKNLEFRIGNYNNDAADKEGSTDPKDLDVGGKYSDGTYGSALTMQIRGYFPDETGGSGINKFYYKTFNNQEVTIDSTKDNASVANGKIYFKTLNDLRDYVIANKTDIFYPLSAVETKRVEYNIGPYTQKESWVDVTDEQIRFGGVPVKDKQNNKYYSNSKGYVQFRTSVVSNFKTTIKGFAEGKNFLVIVAEDNVGNAAVDSAVVGGVTYPCYSLNVDITAPTIPTKQEGTKFTNLKETGGVVISGTVSDKPNVANGSSGLAKIVFTRDGGTGSVEFDNFTAPTTEDLEAVSEDYLSDTTLKHWEVDVKSLLPEKGTAIISALVTDNAGYSTSVPVANITVDKQGPTVVINSPAANAKVGEKLTISGTANDGNGAGLSTDAMILYYTKTEPAKENGTYKTPTSSSGWTQLTTIPIGSDWKKENIDLSSIATDGDNTDVYFTLSAKDTSGTGNDGFAVPLKFTVDRAKPVYSSGDAQIGGKTHTQMASASWFKDDTLVVKGKFSDAGGSGVKKIFYQVDSGDVVELATSDGTYNTNISGFTSDSKLYIWAEDTVGNTTEEDKISYTVKVDNVAPTFAELTATDDANYEDYAFSKVNLTNGNSPKTLKFFVQENESGIKTDTFEDFTIKVGNEAITPTTGSSIGNALNGKRLVTVVIGTTDLAKVSGYQTILATVKDKAGNTSLPQPIGILNKDGDAPVPEFTSPDASSVVNKTITVTGKATDANEITRVDLTATCGTVTKTYQFVKGATSGNTITYANSNWSVSIDTTLLDNTFSETGKDVTLSLTATDGAGNTSTAATRTLKINQNADRPVITIGSGVDFTKKNNNEIWVKGSSTIYGSVSDDDGIASFKIYKKAKNDSAYSDANASYSGGSWNVKLAKDDSYTLKFVVVDRPSAGTGATFTSAAITASSSDAQILTTPIIQDSPEPTEQNQNPTPNKFGNTKANGNTLIPICLDTTPPSLVINAISLDNSIWYEDINKSDLYLGCDNDTLYVKVTASDSSGLYGTTDTSGLTAEFSGTMTVGEDEYELQCPENACTIAKGSGTNEFIITVTNFGTAKKDSTEKPFSGTMTLTITAKDKAEMETPKSLSRTVDNSAPVIKISAPDSVSSTAVVSGTVEGEIVTPSVYFAVTPVEETGADPLTTRPAEDSELWKHERFASLAYNIYFDGTNNETGTHTDLFKQYLVSTGITTADALANNTFRDLTPVYVWIKAEDVCGNISYEKARVVVDPQGNRPNVSVTYPDTNGVKLGGTIRLMGTATDNVEAKYVWIKIDTDGDGEWKLADYNKLKSATNSGYTFGQVSTNKKLGTGADEVNITPAAGNISDIAIMVKVSGGSWNQNINANGELIPSGSTSNDVTMWVSATDDDNGNGTSILESSPVQRNFTVDKDNPYFVQDSLKLITDAGSEQTYKEGMSVKGEWWLVGTIVDDGSGIKKISIKQEGSDNDTPYINNSGDEVTTGDYQFKKHTIGGNTNYDFKIKVGATTGVGEKSFRITAYENNTNNLSTYKDFIVRYDNQPPTYAAHSSGSFKIDSTVKNSQGYYSLSSAAYESHDGDTGVDRIAVYFTRTVGGTTYIFDPMYKRTVAASKLTTVTSGDGIKQDSATGGDMLYWGSATASSITADKLTLSADAASYVHVGGLAKVKGVIYTITSVNGKVIGLSDEPGNTTTSTPVYFAVANVVDNTNPESKKEGSSSNTAYNSTTGFGYGYCNDYVYDDGDMIMENLHKDDSKSWTWELYVNSKNIPDGDVDIHYVVFDKAGNSAHDVISGASVENNKPRLVSVQLGLDKNQNGTIAEDEKTSYYPEGFAEKPVVYTNASTEINISGITVKGKMQVIPEIVGGNEKLFYQWKTKKTTTWQKVQGSGNELMAGNNNYDDADFNNANDYISGGVLTTQTGTISHDIDWLIANSEDNDTDFNMAYEIYDSTEGKTVFSNSNKLSINITGINLQVRDKVAPTVTIDDFYWNSLTDNSVYTSKAANQIKSVADLEGHIELNGDLPESFLATGATDNELDRDDKVSGKIKLKGTVSDNIVLTNLYLLIDGMSGISSSTKVATYDKANGKWKNAAGTADFSKVGTLASDGYEFDIDTASNEFDIENGHSVNWTLLWDTAKIGNVAQNNIKVQLTADDNASAAGHKDDDDNPANFTTTGTRQVDVVPYITDISTGDMDTGTKKFLRRSASGAFVARKGDTTNANVTVKGFNLNGAKVYLGDTQITTTNGNELTVAKSALTKSGKLKVRKTVSGVNIESLNNVNDDSKEYNKEPAQYAPNLTDNRYIYMWDTTTTTFSGTEAVMKPVIDTDGNKTGAMMWYYASNNETLYAGNTKLCDSWGGAIVGGNFAYNSVGVPSWVYLHNTSWSLPNSGTYYKYNYYGSVQWGKTWKDYGKGYNWNVSNNGGLGLGNLSFEDDNNYSSYNDTVMNRYQNMKMAVTGNAKDTLNMVAYFDRSDNTRSIVFWRFHEGTDTDDVFGYYNLTNSTYTDITKEAGNTGNYNSSSYGGNTKNGMKTPKGREEITTVKSGADSNYFDMVYDSKKDVVYIAYYDENAGGLKIKYLNNPAAGYYGHWTNSWSDAIEVDMDAAGQFVSMKTDASGNIHLAYYDSTGSYLKYAMLTPTGNSGAISALTVSKKVLVDTLFTNGMYNSITLKQFGTNDVRPVITSYSISYGGTKYSLRTSWPLTTVANIEAGATDEGYTGKWETVVVVSANAPTQDNTYTETNGTGYTGNIVVGYTASKLEQAELLLN